jgi:hypothetical protein
MQIISLGLTHGSTHDFQLFKAQRKKQRYQAFMLIDKGYLGVVSGNGKYSTLRIFTPTSFNDIQHGIFA